MEKLSNVEKYLSVNLRVNVEAQSSAFPGLYDARIEDVRDKSVFITVPTDRGVPVPLPPTTKLEVSFITGSGRYSFEANILNRVRDRIPMLELSRPEHLVREELREYFRVETRLKVKVVVDRDTDAPEMDGQPERQRVDGVVIDLSGGGARVLTDAVCREGSAIIIDFQNSIGDLGEVPCKVKRVKPAEDSDKAYEVGVEFNSVRDADRDKIIKYVFKRQIEIRQLLQG